MLGTKTMSPLRTGGFPAEQIFELFDKYSSKFSQPESPPPDTTEVKTFHAKLAILKGRSCRKLR